MAFVAFLQGEFEINFKKRMYSELTRLDLHCGGGQGGGGAGGEGGVHGGGGGVVGGQDGRGLRSVWGQGLVGVEMLVVMMVNIRQAELSQSSQAEGSVAQSCTEHIHRTEKIFILLRVIFRFVSSVSSPPWIPPVITGIDGAGGDPRHESDGDLTRRETED